MTELLLGCGNSRVKRMGLPGQPMEFLDLRTCDISPACSPDFVANLSTEVWYGEHFKDDFYAEVHAYEVLEHLGKQGDAPSFFATFGNIWRILRPNGYLFATVPSRFSPWLWGDPGHTRAILPETLTFLDQRSYAQCGKTAMTDYREIYKADFNVIHSTDNKVFHQFALQAIKPARTVE